MTHLHYWHKALTFKDYQQKYMAKPERPVLRDISMHYEADRL